MADNIKEQLELINQQIKEMMGIYRGAISQSEVSDNEFWIWYSLIIMDGEYSQLDICNTWSLSKQTVNTITMHMVKNNYVYLEAVPGSRNRKIIRLTEEGRKYGENIVMPISIVEQKAFERLQLEDRLLFIKVLSKYTELLNEEVKAANLG